MIEFFGYIGKSEVFFSMIISALIVDWKKNSYFAEHPRWLPLADKIVIYILVVIDGMFCPAQT